MKATPETQSAQPADNLRAEAGMSGDYRACTDRERRWRGNQVQL